MPYRLASFHRATGAMQSVLRLRPARFALAAAMFGTLVLAGYAIKPAPLPAPTMTRSDPRQLSSADHALYSAIFDAQRQGDMDMVDTLITQLDNQVLLGHVLANRYMSEDYTTTPDELLTWLRNYGDHPEAPRVAKLAKRKGVEATELSMVTTTAPLKGDGYVFHLGRSTMPDGWYRGLRLWKEGQFTAAANSFRTIGTDEELNSWQRSAGSYWAYRSLLRAGDQRAAGKELARAAEHKLTFYGQLALARQGKSLDIRPAVPSMASSLLRDPHVLRASAFSALEMDDAAEMELRSLYGKLEVSDRPGLLALAAEMNLPNLQVRLAKQGNLSEGEALFGSYPAPANVIDAVQGIVPPALVLAVARHESGFREGASSGAGAVGMMQMLPSTARAVMRHAAIDVAEAGDTMIPIAKRLHDSALSAKLGATYLQMLTQEKAIGGNLMKMLAGYNAGPGSVAGWEKSARAMNDPLLYLESIPYPETHNYVLQVMAHYWIYQHMLGERPSSLEQLANGQWPTIS